MNMLKFSHASDVRFRLTRLARWWPRAGGGLSQRLLAHFWRAKEREQERLVASIIAQAGGRMTDDVERQIMSRMLASGPLRNE